MAAQRQRPQELRPPSAATGGSAREVLRAWIVDEGLHVSLIPAFDDPSAWGLLLADAARHVARAYAAEGDCSEEAAIAQIRFMWSAEFDDPTDLGMTFPQEVQ